MTRKILHLDLDAFFCAVEEQHDPSLKGKAFAVGGKPSERGVVASCSYAARKFGVRSAMPMSTALRLCPHLIIVSHSRGAYSEVSQKVMAKLNNLTPMVEQISIDEAFLDVSLLRTDGEPTAQQLQATIRDQLGLPNSLGVASNKLVAKIANNIGKASARKNGVDGPPNAITVVPAGTEAAFLAPLSVNELWGVGPKTAERLERLGIRTIGALAARSEDEMEKRFGKMGVDMVHHARGIDDRPVETEHETKSISHETTFARDVNNEQILRRTLRALSDSVGRRLRKHGLQGTTIQIKLRWADFTTLTRQITLAHPTDLDNDIYAAADKLFDANWRGQRVRLIGIGVSGFDAESHQIGLWDALSTQQQADRKLQAILDALKDKFGDDAIGRASDLIDEDWHED